MFLTKHILQNSTFRQFLLKNAPYRYLENITRTRIIKKVRSVIPTIPAYCEYLHKHKISTDPVNLKNLAIEDLPLTNKSEYIQKYPLKDICANGTIEDKYCLESSSGYSGEEQYWARNTYEDESFTRYLEVSSKQYLQIDKKSTLLIVCWALGTWVTGEKFAHAARVVACNSNYKLTVITPGNNFPTVINILNKFQGMFDQIVIAGYPFFIKSLLLKGPEIGIDWSQARYHIIIGGEGFPEDLRDFFAKQLHSPVNTFGQSMIASAYGSADTGIGVGHETPFSILIRRLAKKDARLSESLFGTSVHNLPVVFQFNPLNYLIENVDGEIIITAPFNGVPLIRYNLHDSGGVIPYDQINTILEEHGYNPKKELAELGHSPQDLWKLPILYVFGRSDGTIIYNGANIFLENIKEALALPEIVHSNTGRFTLSRILLENFEPKIKIVIELSQGVEVTEQLKTMYEVAVISTLARVNKEYRDQLEKLHDKATPLIEFIHPSIHPEQDTIKHKYI
ncbi:phenylacetate--CoA ligase family protein [PVC group bacterium]|nr:phenylacetate--CoA ligase family protein [PVC group bacterium]